MKAINEQIKLLEDLKYFINQMESEIEKIRNINYRYYLMYGNKIQNGEIIVPNHISFDISLDKNGDAQCQIVDHKEINIESNYQKIKQGITILHQNNPSVKEPKYKIGTKVIVCEDLKTEIESFTFSEKYQEYLYYFIGENNELYYEMEYAIKELEK